MADSSQLTQSGSKGAFTPDANEALRANDLHVNSMQRCDRQSCSNIRSNEVARMARGLKNLNFGGYSHRVNQSGACSSSDVITSGGRKSETTMEDKLIVVVCGYPELYDTTSYFYKNRNTFCNETGAAWQKPLPWREFASVVSWISCANKASKLKMFKRPTMRE